MVFKWKIVRPPFHGVAANAEVMHPGIETEFETGSIGEAYGIFTDNKTELGQMFGADVMASASALAMTAGGGDTEEAAPEGDQPTAKKERKKRNGGGDPSTATAPEPIAIPPLPPAPPALPPVPPGAPPTGVLAGEIAAELDKRATGAADGGQALADWLATSGITVKGATYAEAIEVLRLQADEKLGPIAGALGVA